MKLNIAYPDTGCKKTIEVEDDKALLPFIEKRMGQEVIGDSLGNEFKGYIFRISGGNDKQGFPMMQGVISNQRVKILFRKGMPCFRPRRTGQMKRKSVRGCIVGTDLAVLSLKIVKKGSSEIPGLTDERRPKRLGPKRAGKIRQMFNLAKADDVTRYVIRRQTEYDSKKGETVVKKIIKKAPKIQRLVTDARLQRKRRYKAELKKRQENTKMLSEKYKEMVKKQRTDSRNKRAVEVSKKKITKHLKV